MGKSLWAEVIPYGTRSDAEMLLPTVLDRLGRNPRALVHIAEQTLLSDVRVPGVQNVLAVDRRTEGLERPTADRILAGTVGRYLFVVDCQGYADRWTWEEVVLVASRQAAKLGAVA